MARARSPIRRRTSRDSGFCAKFAKDNTHRKLTSCRIIVRSPEKAEKQWLELPKNYSISPPPGNNNATAAIAADSKPRLAGSGTAASPPADEPMFWLWP